LSTLYRKWESFYNGRFPGLTRKTRVFTSFLNADLPFPIEPTKTELVTASNIEPDQVLFIDDAVSDSTLVRAIEGTTSAESPNYAKISPLFSNHDDESPREMALITYTTANFALIGGGTVASIPDTIMKVSIDLTDAPDGDYKYVLLATAELTHSKTSSGVIYAHVQQYYAGEEAFQDTTKQYGVAAATLENQNGADSEVFNYGSTSVHTLRGGEKREYHLQVYMDNASSGVNTAITSSNVRMYALRIDNKTNVSVGTGKNGETTTSAPSTSEVTHLTLPTLTADDYLVFASWGAGHDTDAATETVTSYLRDESATTMASSVSFGSVPTTTKWHGAVTQLVTSAGSGNITLKVANSTTTGNAKLYDGCIVAVLKSDITSATGTYSAAGASTNNQPSWTTLLDLGVDSSAINGDFLDLISFTATKSADTDHTNWYLRPNFASDTSLGLAGFNESWKSAPITFMHREERGQTAANNTLEVIYNDNTGPTIAATQASFIHIKEPASYTVTETESTTILVDFEEAQILRYGWTSVGGGVYTYDLSSENFHDLKDLYLNRVRMTRLDSWSAGTDNTWHFDPSVGTLTMEIDSADTPEDDDVWISYVATRLIGGKSIDIQKKGVSIPYDDRLSIIPGTTTNLKADQGKPAAESGVGELVLANGDGYYDDVFSQKTLSGYNSTIRRGFPDFSSDLDDFPVIGRALMGITSLSQDNMRVNLFDRSLLLNLDVEVGKATIYRGQAGATYEIEDFQFPLVYGYVRRCPAFRVTNDYTTGSGVTNIYSFSRRVCRGGTEVYENVDSYVPVSATTISVVGAYGAVVISNDAWDNDGPNALLPDVVYVDVYGFTETNNYLSKVIHTPGRIIYDFLTTYGELDDEDIDIESLNRLDLPYKASPPLRHQFEDGFAQWIPPQIGILVPGGESVASAMNLICRNLFAYWRTNAQGRITVNVPDMTRGNLVSNGDFELYNYDTVYDCSGWTTSGGATKATQAGGFRGNYSMRVGNAGNASTHVYQAVDLPSGGWYVAEVMAKLVSGESGEAAISFQNTQDEQYFSESVTLTTTEWKRIYVPMYVRPEETGNVLVRVHPTRSSTTSTQVDFDDVHVRKVFAIVDRNNTEVFNFNISPDDYYAAAVTFDGDWWAPNQSPYILIENSEAQGVITTQPEGRQLVKDTGVVSFKEGNIHQTALSAASTAAPAALYYGRQRIEMTLTVYGFTELPQIGDWVLVLDKSHDTAHPRIPNLVDGAVMWSVKSVDFDPSRPTGVDLVCEVQIDPSRDTLKR